MIRQENQLVKILFRFYSDLLEKETVERLWAEVVNKANGLYKIDSIPFFVTGIAPGDTVLAEFDETEQMLTYRSLIDICGNSVISVVVMEKATRTKDIIAILDTFKCATEVYAEGYFVMEILVDVDYRPIKNKLQDLKELGVIDYAEPCLADQHRY